MKIRLYNVSVFTVRLTPIRIHAQLKALLRASVVFHPSLSTASHLKMRRVQATLCLSGVAHLTHFHQLAVLYGDLCFIHLPGSKPCPMYYIVHDCIRGKVCNCDLAKFLKYNESSQNYFLKYWMLALHAALEILWYFCVLVRRQKIILI